MHDDGSGRLDALDPEVLVRVVPMFDEAGALLASLGAAVLAGVAFWRFASSPLRYRRWLAWIEAGALMLITVALWAWAAVLASRTSAWGMVPCGSSYVALASLPAMAVAVTAVLRLGTTALGELARLDR